MRPYESTLYELILLRRELLLGISIVDSLGHQRPGPEVWERLKQAFPRIVRAMLIHLRTLSEPEQRRITVDFERDINFKGRSPRKLSREKIEQRFAEPRSVGSFL
jgi:hypothetical protein